MSKDLLSHYSRQINLVGFGESGQRKLLESNVLVLGLGGLGSPVAMYLAAAGVGKLTLGDFDQVDESNLQRQIIHQHKDLGELKVESAAQTLRELNPAIKIESLAYALDAKDILKYSKTADAVVDCSDNFATRFALNRAALATRTPLISGAAIRWEGQITSFDARDQKSPCYQCLYADEDIADVTCEREGVVSPLVGVVGTMQAMETVHVLLSAGKLRGMVWLFDARTMVWQSMKLAKNPRCRACGK